MKRVTDHKEQIGYLTFVQNNENTNYLRLAYACGLSLKATQQINKFAIVVDEATKKELLPEHFDVFDYVLDIPWGDDSEECTWKLKNEWKAWSVTPFKETIKIDCDMIFTASIDHWYNFLRQQEVFITTKVLDVDNNIAKKRKYRKVFDQNNLPNTYSGFMYFRYGQESMQLFKAMKWVYSNWDFVTTELLSNAFLEEPTTDLVLAIATALMDFNCTNTSLSFPTFVHLKPSIIDWPTTVDIENNLMINYTGDFLTVKFKNQIYPVHGADCKTKLANTVINYYERKE
jgi:hypothetical protein